MEFTKSQIKNFGKIRIFGLNNGGKVLIDRDWDFLEIQNKGCTDVRLFSSGVKNFIIEDKKLLDFTNEVFERWDLLPCQNTFVNTKSDNEICGLSFKDSDPYDYEEEDYDPYDYEEVA